MRETAVFWVKRVQVWNEAANTFHDDQVQLNLQRNNDDVCGCRPSGQTARALPNLPAGSRYVHREACSIMDAHIRTLHPRVGLQ